jgi:hypothetical protein
MGKHVSSAAKVSGKGNARAAAPKLKKTAFGNGNSSSNPDRKMSAAKV